MGRRNCGVARTALPPPWLARSTWNPRRAQTARSGAPPGFALPSWPRLTRTAGACGACAGWQAQDVLLSHLFIPFFLSRYAKGTPSDSGVVRNRLQFALPNVRRKPC